MGSKKQQFKDLNPCFGLTFRLANGGYQQVAWKAESVEVPDSRYAGGSYQEVARKPEYTEVPDSRYEAKQNSEFSLNSDGRGAVSIGLSKVATSSIKSAPTHCWWYVMLVSISDRAFPRGLQW